MITSRDPATPAVTWGDSGLSIRLHRKVEVAAGGRGVIVVFAVIVVVDCCGGMPTFRSAGELDRRTRLAAWTSCWIGGRARRPMILDPHSVIWASRVPVCILSP